MVVIDSTQVQVVQLVVSFDKKFQKFNYITLMNVHLTANQSAKKWFRLNHCLAYSLQVVCSPATLKTTVHEMCESTNLS